MKSQSHFAIVDTPPGTGSRPGAPKARSEPDDRDSKSQQRAATEKGYFALLPRSTIGEEGTRSYFVAWHFPIASGSAVMDPNQATVRAWPVGCPSARRVPGKPGVHGTTELDPRDDA
jgi:hypothetical protein